MGTYSTYGSSKSSSSRYSPPPRGKYSSSATRRTRRIKQYGGRTAGDSGTRRAGRTESRMQLMRKHRAARRAQRKEAGIYGKSEAAKQKTQMRGEQRQSRRSMYRRHSAVGRSYAGSRYGGRTRPTLRQRATSRGQVQRAGSPSQKRGRPGIRGVYGRGTKSRRDQMREALRD